MDCAKYWNLLFGDDFYCLTSQLYFFFVYSFLYFSQFLQCVLGNLFSDITLTLLIFCLSVIFLFVPLVSQISRCSWFELLYVSQNYTLRSCSLVWGVYLYVHSTYINVYMRTCATELTNLSCNTWDFQVLIWVS